MNEIKKIIINSIKRVLEAPPGLLTMKDLPIVCAWAYNKNIIKGGE